MQQAICHFASTEMTDAEFEHIQTLRAASLGQWDASLSGSRPSFSLDARQAPAFENYDGNGLGARCLCATSAVCRSHSSALHDVIQLEAERLRRVSRWRGADDAGKDIVRAYAKAILSLQELKEAAGKLPMHAVQTQGPTTLKFSEPTEVGPLAVVIKSAVRPRAPESPTATGS